ncbi:MAG TPA: phage holin family protein [Cellvibrio sp.]|nr:phage holin family protein [Cellvibrio sp.]
MDNGGDQNWIGFLVMLLMGVWGGFVNHLGRLRRGEINLSKRFQELAIDVLTSSFSAVVIGLALMSADVHPLLCFAVAGVGGHAGARLIFKLERLLFNRVDSFSPKK